MTLIQNCRLTGNPSSFVEKGNCTTKQDFTELIAKVKSSLDLELIHFVKCPHLTPPSTLPYDIGSVADPSEFSKQIQELFKHRTTPGFFIECEAHDGVFLSNTLVLERDRGWTGLLVEMEPQLFARLRRRHRKAWMANLCLSPTNLPMEIEFVIKRNGDEDWIKGGTSLNLKDLKITKDIFLPPVGLVPCIPVVTLLTALNVSHVDYLSLDVQGVDLKVLKTLPFDDSLVIDVIQASYDESPEGPSVREQEL